MKRREFVTLLGGDGAAQSNARTKRQLKALTILARQGIDLGMTPKEIDAWLMRT